MIYDLPPLFDPPALSQGEQSEPIRRKRRGREARPGFPYGTALAIGMIFLMDDGGLCQIVQVEPYPICLPLKEANQ